VNKQNANNNRTSGKGNNNVNSRSYTPISDALAQPQVFADTELADGIKRHSLVNLFASSFSKSRRADGEPLAAVLGALLVWPLLKVRSIHCFCYELCQFLSGKKDDSHRRQDILYGVLGREDINWRKQSQTLAMSVVKQNEFGPVGERAFVVDDSIKQRRGKKVEGSSNHWDHTESRTIFGQQVLEFGLASASGYQPLDRQIYMSSKNAVEKPEDKDFHDKRSAAARDMARARDESKHAMFRRMLNSAVKRGLKAKYVLGDAWFGCKENIEAAEACGVSAIFQMKRGQLQYWIESGGKDEGRYYTAKQLYETHKRSMKKASKKARYKTCRIEAWVNVETDAKKEIRLQKVILVLSSPAQSEDRDGNWVIFLSTDVEASAEKILKIYALRWSIEVYFKEVKQHFGFLAEQSSRYQFSYASVHLAAMRYSLLFEAMLRSGGLTYGEVRDGQSGKLELLSYAGLMWQLFRGLIDGALDGLVRTLGRETIDCVTNAIDEAVDSFLNRALQIEPGLIQAQLHAESIGEL
jgi:hypothetical protein